MTYRLSTTPILALAITLLTLVACGPKEKKSYEKYAVSASGKSRFDIVFIDPPYAERLLPSALKALFDNGLLKDTSIIICEDERDGLMENTDVSSRYSLSKQARYGRVFIYYLSPKAAE